MKRSLSILAFAALTCVVAPMVALAQAQYPPPIPTATFSAPNVLPCIDVDDLDGLSVPERADRGSHIIVTGPQGTAEAGGHIELFIDRKETKVGEFDALEDGSFAYTLGLPMSIRAGAHRIIGVLEECGEGSDTVDVVESQEVAVGDEEPSVGAAGAGRGGSLPRTGLPILWLILVAVLLMAVGMLFRTARNRRRIPAPISGVARVDTRSFVPRTSLQPRG